MGVISTKNITSIFFNFFFVDETFELPNFFLIYLYKNLGARLESLFFDLKNVRQLSWSELSKSSFNSSSFNFEDPFILETAR